VACPYALEWRPPLWKQAADDQVDHRGALHYQSKLSWPDHSWNKVECFLRNGGAAGRDSSAVDPRVDLQRAHQVCVLYERWQLT